MAKELKPITTSRFVIDITGLGEITCKSISEFSVEGIAIGGDKEMASGPKANVLRQSTSGGYQNNPNFTLEVYLLEDSKIMYDWFNGTMLSSYNGGGEYYANRKDGTITAFGPNGQEIVLQWQFQNAWIKGYTIPDFDVESGDFAVESYEIVCEDFKRTV